MRKKTSAPVAPPDPEGLIGTYRSYAHSLARRVVAGLPTSIDVNDILGYAELGLTQASRSFDPARGAHFKTFAYYRIRGAIYDGLRSMGWFSKTEYRKYLFAVRANEFLRDYSEFPGREHGADLQQADDLMGSVLSCYLLSLDEVKPDYVADPTVGAEQRLYSKELAKTLHACLQELPEKNRTVLQDYYFKDRTLQEIGESLGLSKSWVSRIHARSLEKMRDLLRDYVPNKGGNHYRTSTKSVRKVTTPELQDHGG